MKHLVLVLFILFSWTNTQAQSPIEINGPLSVSGNRIVNQNNQPVSFSGGSLFWSNNGWGGENFYRASTVGWLYNYWNADIVRAAMGVDENGGYLSHPVNKDKVITVVDAAIQQGMYVIIDWHSHHAEDYEAEAIAFFEEMATLYGNTPNVIYEIYNEPLQVSWTNIIKPYAENVIAAIRAIDPDNLIIVGSPRWSQDVDAAAANPITGFSNIAYTLHFYAGTHGQWLRNKAINAMNNGIALMVTEWGTINASGDGNVAIAETQNWIDFMCEHQLTNLNWAVNDKAEGASVLKPGTNPNGNWGNNDLTPSGVLVKDLILNWQANCGESTTRVNDLTGQITNFKVFPNPADAFVDIQFTNATNEKFEVSVTNLLGQEIFAEGAQTSAYQKRLDVTTFTDSLYFVSVRMADGVQTRKLFLR